MKQTKTNVMHQSLQTLEAKYLSIHNQIVDARQMGRTASLRVLESQLNDARQAYQDALLSM